MTDIFKSSIGEFVTASGEKLNLDQTAISRVVLVGSDKPETLLSKLDADELAELEKWTAAQTGSPVNLMRWPGWPEALRRHVIESKAGGNNA
ncbi:hypothetical protein [Pseudomonas juntendi]|uniref:Uncharacterized protein n=1 Tax=Pseudomonas juntendi TaxID=2666183 RepID=A0A7W2JMC0_9PSED|nr:hypothetical protein [Pseudomonas juntendi]EJG5355142.1 hypothetical protein [Salmonella enterica]EPL59855.1 hypothetical protein B382_24028 [Stutzerimonas stutzeri B1SMN1]MBA6061634.1 hypothetical protein [Pseudomonas juntendi]